MGNANGGCFSWHVRNCCAFALYEPSFFPITPTAFAGSRLLSALPLMLMTPGAVHPPNPMVPPVGATIGSNLDL